jgi:hypothetical protein
MKTEAIPIFIVGMAFLLVENYRLIFPTGSFVNKYG